ncbi:LysR substrate-binding domain-containing protein [Ruegeria sp. 2205SS24-7]|uniref:LysR substrate-binding domain-containing protein n=1 Tax=Ruegeria discodermiae TaxID=3064389 RepID=UPI0027404DDA|nr:LysR substrate-binding domain-containing protein [Ruegeria sp. 2205SS24-7]MDP5220958.1 LysR substrate-binding domain-containing protein [Ruegeria sp. 2205SS24-7]
MTYCPKGDCSADDFPLWTIRVTATDALVAYVLPKCLKALRAQHPSVHVELVSSMSQADIARHEADIAIRHVRPEQPDLLAQWIGDFDVSMYASSEYLATLGNPERLVDFSRANFIGFEHPERLVQQVVSMGIPVTKHNFDIVATSGMVTYELARAGLGIALLPSVVAVEQFGLQQIHPDLGKMQMPIWLVTHADVKTNARIRLCFGSGSL